MKILLINSSDINGGAARATYRLHQALLDNHINSQLLVQSKISDDYTVLSERTKIKRALNMLRPAAESLAVKYYKNKTATLFSDNWLSNSPLIDKINAINPDIVHLHWINGGMIKIEELAKINAPIVWSLHDMWAFTGGCHYDEECGAYTTHCQNCKVLGSHKKKDLSYKIFNRKQHIFSSQSALTIVALSQWLAECAKNSRLLKNQKVINLPNLINTSIYKPIDKQICRQLWNLPENKKLVLFGAMGATSDPRKGFKQLTEALKKVSSKDIELVIFGSTQPQFPSKFIFKTHYLGQLNDDISLVSLYSAVDVMLVPSIQENLSNTIMESLSCATPVVGFNIGGNPDMIDHKKNGYLAKPFNITDLAKGIDWALKADFLDSLSKNARKKVINSFDSKLVVNQYIRLYQTILSDQRTQA